jgi:hypothetical protein
MRSKYNRREFVTISAVGVSVLAVGGLTGCGNGGGGGGGVSEPEPVKPESASDEELALQQASDDWDLAYSGADNYWSSLQNTVAAADAKSTEFKSQVITTPEALIEFESKLNKAKSLDNQHLGMVKPEGLSELRESTKKLNDITDVYKDAEDALRNSWNAVKVVNPMKMEFDVVDDDGYSYHVAYNMGATFSVDTTEGKPGQTALYMDISGCSITVKNTTSGKKAPGVTLSCAPLYSIDSFLAAVEKPTYCFAEFGPLNEQYTYSSLSDNWRNRSKLFSPLYINPYDNDPDMHDDFSALGSITNIEIVAGVLNSSYGSYRMWAGTDFEVNESRTMDVRFSQYADYRQTKVKVGEINEEYIDLFKRIVGWAIHLNLFYKGYSDNQICYCLGTANKSSDLGDDWLVYTYNPIPS